MARTKVIASLAVAALIGAGPSMTPAVAATSHWSKTQCQTWERGFLKRNPHASKARKAEGNKALKSRGCAQRIK